MFEDLQHLCSCGTGDQSSFDDAPIGRPPPGGMPVFPGLQTSYKYKKTTPAGEDGESFDLEERIALNRRIRHDVVTAKDWAVNGER